MTSETPAYQNIIERLKAENNEFARVCGVLDYLDGIYGQHEYINITSRKMKGCYTVRVIDRKLRVELRFAVPDGDTTTSQEYEAYLLHRNEPDYNFASDPDYN